MKKEQLFKLLNTGKRDHTGIKKGKKHTFKCILMKYTGISIVSTFIQTYTSLKDDLTIVFKPIKNFTKKQLKGLDKHDLATHRVEAEEERRKKKENLSNLATSKHIESVDRFDNGFDNWFDINGNQEGPMKKRITLKKEDGRVVGLDDYKNDIIW